MSENDWWALGQHHGLVTPLLDWTVSPFAAAFFAFANDGTNQTAQRTVLALTVYHDKTNDKIRAAHTGEGRTDILEFVRPLSDENARLVNQGGLFTRAPSGVDLESWITTHYKGERLKIQLIKITVPNKDRKLCLRELNRMNINHLTLFPDLYGASVFCNLDLEIETY